jgi:hypothetical protein
MPSAGIWQRKIEGVWRSDACERKFSTGHTVAALHTAASEHRAFRRVVLALDPHRRMNYHFQNDSTHRNVSSA